MTAPPALRPRLLVVAGPNGAGKTTITERGLAHEWFHDCEYINPDAIAQDELGERTARPEINAARVARRVLQGGHEVPIRKIVDRWARSIANAASVAAEVDRFYVYDNSVDDRDAQLVLRAAEGHVVRAYADAPIWAGPILERLVLPES